MESWVYSTAFKVYYQFSEIKYHLIVTSVPHHSFHNGIAIVYIHYVYLLFPLLDVIGKCLYK